ncbi:predicted protein [Plenodomus lingam JN3]|uniref:Predicted protein n=1 Tax=Leptosphaeria maculans (strain JN3 / isolate v23.1.3 / race Av1-4-5-6-7-8) TaxID=985895 RepID=E5A3J9_LEPMJ|nr:predicted protein [Plenodomus lingam JN3]CBX98212.1 predicted protein [Plenodomus lingam JN3]
MGRPQGDAAARQKRADAIAGQLGLAALLEERKPLLCLDSGRVESGQAGQAGQAGQGSDGKEVAEATRQETDKAQMAPCSRASSIIMHPAQHQYTRRLAA